MSSLSSGQGQGSAAGSREPRPTRDPPGPSGTFAVDESGIWAWSRRWKSGKPKKRKAETYGEVDKVIDDGIRRSDDRDANRGGKTNKTLAMLDQIRAAGVAVDELIGDRHDSYKKVERWVQQLLKRGIKQVVELVEGQQGFADAAGTRVAAGVPHCPATPERLGVIPRPGPKPKTPTTVKTAGTDAAQRAQQDTHRTFNALIAERMPYALQRHGGSATDPNKYRWQCPAVAGKVGCRMRADTVNVAKQAGLPVIESPPAPAGAPKVCTGNAGTVTLKVKDLQLKVQQEDYWESTELTTSYARRTYIEGYFGTLKDAAVANLVRGSLRGDCLGLKLLRVRFCCAKTNFRLLRKWHSTTGNRLDLPDLLLAPDDHPTEFVLDEDDEAVELVA